MQWRSSVLLEKTKAQEKLRTATRLVVADLFLLQKLVSMAAIIVDDEPVELARGRFFENSAMETIRSFAEADTNEALDNLILGLAERHYHQRTVVGDSIPAIIHLVLRDSTAALETFERVYTTMATIRPWNYRRGRVQAAFHVMAAARAAATKVDATAHTATPSPTS